MFNEADNVGPLIEKINEVRAKLRGCEIVVDFIDDSPDRETARAIHHAAIACPDLTVDSFYRMGRCKWGGLSGAVIDGMDRALEWRADYIVVMDGDGQHPASTIADLVWQIAHANFDLVVASRYADGGSNEGLDGEWRVFVSRAATWVAKSLFPIKLRGVSDPMTGFFIVRSSAIDTMQLSKTDGFKILLELLVTSESLRVSEVPVIFGKREHGESKGTREQGVKYLKQLMRLRVKRFGSYVADRRSLAGV